MIETGAGTGIMLAVAAVLWFLYLLPTWIQKRSYTTERAAERVQATMDAMAAREELRARHAAEDAERAAAEAQARYAAELEERARERAYARAQARSARAADRADAAHARAYARPAPVRGRDLGLDPVLRQRIRRTRMLASALMVGATIVALVQLWLMSTTGTTVGSWVVLTGALLAGVVAIAVQRRLDVRATSARRAVPPVRREARIRVGVPVASVPVEEPAREWTPVGLPAPRTAGARETLQPRIDPERLRREAEERAARAGRPEPEVVPFRRRADEQPAAGDVPTPTRGSRWAAMGRVDQSAVGAVDLDAALQRRRSAG